MIIEQNNSEIITGRRVHTFFFFRFLIFSFSFHFLRFNRHVRVVGMGSISLLSSMVSPGLLLIGFSLFLHLSISELRCLFLPSLYLYTISILWHENLNFELVNLWEH